jgi:hypothetical protein
MRLPKEQAKWEILLEPMGADGAYLLKAVRTAPDTLQLWELPG